MFVGSKEKQKGREVFVKTEKKTVYATIDNDKSSSFLFDMS
jgi:hypothetical protein